jgi:hypothetical protein
MKNILKKQLTGAVIALTVAVALPMSTANAFEIPGMGGGSSSSSSSVNWSDLASTGQSAEKDIYAGARLLALSTITMAEALGFKDVAAALKAQVNGISEDGSVSGDFDLGETSELSGSVFEKIRGDKKQLANLDASQKAKLTDSMSQYVVGGIRYIKGVKSIKDVASSAKDAPMMQMSNFVGLIKLAPVAVTGAKDFFGKVPEVIKLMSAVDVAMPDNISDIPGASSF